MSLVDMTLPSREASLGDAHEQKKSYRDSMPGAPKPLYTRQSYDGTILDDMYNDGMISPTTAHVQQAEQPPALPQKSALRASRLLNAFDLNKTPATPTETTMTAGQAEATPHDVYMSSEEDASSSADDFSDYDYESESGESENGGIPRRRSHEDTARVVSVVFMGRPSIVDVVVSRRSTSPNSSIEGRRQSSMGSLTESATSSVPSSRRMSTSSTAASSVITHTLPARTTSMGVEMMRGAKKPTFLSIDPFATTQRSHTEPAALGEDAEQQQPLRTPKTPTAMFKKTFSLVKKRSRSTLTGLATSGHNGSQTTLPASPLANNFSLEDVREAGSETAHSPLRPAGSSKVTYNDILRSARKSSTLSTPLSPVPSSPTPASEKKASRILSGFNMARRKSIKITNF